ncbi:MAG: hypothetical protein EAZ57_11630 [Cytophagales bacterium]|nr:MAG: hypothetical protein EAZ67_12595 [Cytophagales bacterium]TAF59299.1 MAG: hypothetical protein EAZ57_11630 [Cytophagales bacterium]
MQRLPIFYILLVLALSMLGCQESSQVGLLREMYQPCEDGAQMPIKTTDEFMALIKNSQWRLVAKLEDVARRPAPGGDSLVIWTNKPTEYKLNFVSDSLVTVLTYNMDAMGKTTLASSEQKHYYIALTFKGHIAARYPIQTTHPNGTPKTEYVYFYFCDKDKLVQNFTFLQKLPQNILHNIYRRD